MHIRADRLISILLLLQVHRRLTARELARRLEVSERTILRDMEALSGAGVPVTAERGPGGGWRLTEEYETRLTGLGPAEIAALFLPQPDHVLKDLGLHQAAEAARIRLSAALPSSLRPGADYVRERIYIDPAGWQSAGEEITALPVLQEALFQERRLQMTYERGDGTAVERLVDPLGLVAKGRAWYLVARSDGEPRTYRVSRVRAAAVTEQPATRPPGFDLAAYWAAAATEFVANLPRYPVTFRVAGEILRRIRYAQRFSRIEQVGPPEVGGWCTVQMLFETDREAAEFALSFGPKLEVLQPPELRAEVIRRAEATVAFYQERERPGSA